VLPPWLLEIAATSATRPTPGDGASYVGGVVVDNNDDNNVNKLARAALATGRQWSHAAVS
jgi:hypothetical protein